MLLPAEVHHDARVNFYGLAIEPVGRVNPLPCRSKRFHSQGAISADQLHVFQTAVLTDGGCDDYRSVDAGGLRK